jgi:hypothetical protein
MATIADTLKHPNPENLENPKILIIRALKDLNPRHLVLETNVLPTELRTHVRAWSDFPDPRTLV